jgi:hypothetical protein
LEVLLDETQRARKVASDERQRADAGRLAVQQQAFCGALFDADLETQALPMFKDDARLAQRFALYRGNLSNAWDKTLASAYPVLQALVGEEFFGALARAYGKAHPSGTGDLNRFGAHFADFLNDFPHVADYPYFPDMARLEWALHRAHYADNVPPLDGAALAQLAPEQLDAARLLLHPACRLIASEWAVVELWHAHQADADGFPQQLARRDYGIVVRPQWQAGVLSLSPGAYAALGALQQGEPLGMALDAALEHEPEFDFGIELQRWLRHGVLTGIDLINH